jgi:hypothetical protein
MKSRLPSFSGWRPAVMKKSAWTKEEDAALREQVRAPLFAYMSVYTPCKRYTVANRVHLISRLPRLMIV